MAAHPGPVAGDSGQDSASGEENEQPSVETPGHQPYSMIEINDHNTYILTVIGGVGHDDVADVDVTDNSRERHDCDCDPGVREDCD